MIRRLNFALALLIGTGFAAPAMAACNDICKENRAIWKTKKTVDVGGDDYLVAIAPGNAYALVKWKRSVKSITVEDVDAAIHAVSGCRGVDRQGLARLQKAKGGSISTEIANGSDYIRFDMRC